MGKAKARNNSCEFAADWENNLSMPRFYFVLTGVGTLGINVSWDEQEKDYKDVYKANEKAMEKAPTKYKSTDKKEVWLPFTRGVEKKADVNKIPKDGFARKGIVQGRTPGEEKYKKDMGIKPNFKKECLFTRKFKPGKNGVKEADIKGAGTKPNTKQYKVLDTVKRKGIKIDKVKKLHNGKTSGGGG